ncbi:type IV pilus assembly protein PilW [Marinobacterium halophilum]|uniref:Type IV pilus assembly protein PilW n=1 Tax=Marinobacterium halophilum TaxID=267374 RepID=A0A2P8F2B8_9GAMM|nr:PilW family protein [Marinobacterium halophilum]PSL15849.1 type IV pilus assembly protein PilW [Marinobacterium halophilum]
MDTVYRRQAGFSLIELMIGLTIGLFILMGVVMVYVSSTRSQAASEALARVQESGRFATYLMTKEVRQAGFKYACPGEINNLLDTDNGAYKEELFDLNNAVLGWQGGTGPLTNLAPDYVRGDALLIKHAAHATGAVAKGNNPVQASAIAVEKGHGIKKGSIIMIADAYGCDLFQSGNNENASSLNRGAGGTPGNLNKAAWSHQYDDDLQILYFTSVLYYIGTGSNGQPALKAYRVMPSAGGGLGQSVELVSGVEDMRLVYGLDTDGSGSANAELDAYVQADNVSDWDEVVSVRIGLLTTSPTGGLNDVEQSLTWPFDLNGDGAPDEVEFTPDGHLRSLFTTTVAIRNRLP